MAMGIFGGVNNHPKYCNYSLNLLSLNWILDCIVSVYALPCGHLSAMHTCILSRHQYIAWCPNVSQVGRVRLLLYLKSNFGRAAGRVLDHERSLRIFLSVQVFFFPWIFAEKAMESLLTFYYNMNNDGITFLKLA